MGREGPWGKDILEEGRGRTDDDDDDDDHNGEKDIPG